jgi:hypothetical protein
VADARLSARTLNAKACKLGAVQRAIRGFERDEEGEWVALLECGHRQHVRHRPPWQERPWVVTEVGREARIGTPLNCPACDELDDAAGEGGDPACLAHLVCPQCGAVVEGGYHRPGCSVL